MSSKLKIAYILGCFPTLSETFIVNEIVQLIRQGIDVSIFSLMWPQEKIIHKSVLENKLLERTHYFRYRYLFSLNPESKLRFLWYYFQLRWGKYRNKVDRAHIPALAFFSVKIRSEPYNLIHSHFVSEAAIFVSKLSKIPFSFTAHCFSNLMSKEAKKELIERISYAKKVVAVCGYTADGLRSLSATIPDNKIQIVHCGINSELFMGKETGRPPQKFQALLIARLTPMKGIEYLIRAVPLLLESHCDIFVKIVGNGEEKEKLEGLINKFRLSEKTIKICPAVANEKVAEILSGADVYVLPSIEADDGSVDGLPVSLMEAMAMELPVISTPAAGIPELVVHMETGILVPQKDPYAIAQAIKTLYSDRELCQKLGRNGREKVVKEFNTEVSGKQIRAIFGKVIVP